MKLLTLVLSFSLLGACQKQYDRPASSDVVNDLSARRYDAVIGRIDADTTDLQQRFYLASAYAGRSNLDVLALYPLLEMYLFNRPATGWDELSEIKDPYRRFVRRLNRRGRQDDEARASMEAEYVRMLRERYGWDEPAPRSEYCDGEKRDIMIAYESSLIAHWEKELAANRPILSWWELYYIQASPGDVGSCYNVFDDRMNNFKVYFSALREAGIGIEVQEEEENGSVVNTPAGKVEQLLMEVLWHTYEAVPFLQRIPTVESTSQGDLSRAIDMMMTLRHDPQLGERAIQSVVAWSVISVLSVYRSAFNLEHSSDLKEMYCGMAVATTLDHYPILVTRLRTLLTLFQESQEAGRHSPQVQDYISTASTYLDGAPAELGPALKGEVLQAFRLKQLENCLRPDT